MKEERNKPAGRVSTRKWTALAPESESGLARAPAGAVELDKPPRKSKLQQEPKAAKPSDKLRRDPLSPASGQVGPKSCQTPCRAEKTGKKLNGHRDKLAKQNPAKRRGLMRPVGTVAHTAMTEMSAKAHQKVSQVEHENVGVEAAHKVEIYAERAGRAAVHHVRQRNRTRPARKAAKLEKKHIKASADTRFKQMAQENPELKRNALKRYVHKKRIQRQYRKQAQDTAKKAASEAASGIERATRAVAAFVRRHPVGALILALCFLLIFTLQSCIGAAINIAGGLGAAISTSYLAEDEDIDDAELTYTEWEADMEMRARNAENDYPGYDEYRYDIGPVGHDPYAMIAYLTAKHDAFTFTQVQAELWEIFNLQYSLIYTLTVETRYRWVYSYGGWEEVPYDYYILTVTLTSQPFDNVILPRLTTQDEQERYEVYMLLHGNRQYVGSPFPFNWHPYVSSYYGYRIHPIGGYKDYHQGVDIGVPIGTPILAGGDGMILQAFDNGGYGLMALVDYGNGITARYAHCSALPLGAGTPVKKGDVIALSGNTGSSTGPHLHFEVHKNGKPLNPLYFADGTVG